MPVICEVTVRWFVSTPQFLRCLFSEYQDRTKHMLNISFLCPRQWLTRMMLNIARRSLPSSAISVASHARARCYECRTSTSISNALHAKVSVWGMTVFCNPDLLQACSLVLIIRTILKYTPFGRWSYSEWLTHSFRNPHTGWLGKWTKNIVLCERGYMIRKAHKQHLGRGTLSMRRLDKAHTTT